MKRKHYKLTGKTTKSRTFLVLGNYTKMFIPLCLLALMVGSICYISLISIVMWNTTKRATFEKKLSSLSETVINLESKFSSMQKKVTLSLAESKGFKETTEIKYLTTQPLTRVVGVNEMEL